MKRLLGLLFFCCTFAANASILTTFNTKLYCDKTPGLADANVLALSWQPGFCQSYGASAKKPECLKLSSRAYAYNHLVLHGLWPNQDSCGHNYGFCTTSAKKHHCDYAPVPLTATVSEHLKQLMPSYAYGSCLERHEWNKHGTCQLLDSSDYFDQAMTLVDQVNQLKIIDFLQQYQGQTIALTQLKSELETSLGQNAKQKIYIGCSKGLLVDIYLSLPATFDATTPLNQLLTSAPNMTSTSNCPAQVKISDFTA